MIAALLSGDVERFYAQEIEERRRGGLPPFGRLAALIVSGADRGGAEALCARAGAHRLFARPDASAGASRRSAANCRRAKSCCSAPPRRRSRCCAGAHRFRLLVKAPRNADLQGFLRALLAAAPPPRGGVRVAVDVDPQSFM